MSQQESSDALADPSASESGEPLPPPPVVIASDLGAGVAAQAREVARNEAAGVRQELRRELELDQRIAHLEEKTTRIEECGIRQEGKLDRILEMATETADDASATRERIAPPPVEEPGQPEVTAKPGEEHPKRRNFLSEIFS